MARQTPWERIRRMARVTESGCWEWQGHKNWKGYGKVSVGRRCVSVHRVVYEMKVGPIPTGMVIDHLCRNRACLNPAHLEPVTIKENVHRGEGIAARNRAKSHCPAGHELSADNVYSRASRSERACRRCALDRSRASRAKHKGVVRG